MRLHRYGLFVPVVAPVLAFALAACDDAGPIGSAARAPDAQVSANRAPQADAAANDPLLRTTLVGNAVTGAAGAIRGFNPAGRTWVIDPRSEARISARGELRIDVRGLVFATDPNAGTNPSAFFRGAVSCLTFDGGAVVDPGLVTTGQFPASPDGDARIRETLILSDPCLAPAIFVTNAGGTAWFAVSGM